VDGFLAFAEVLAQPCGGQAQSVNQQVLPERGSFFLSHARIISTPVYDQFDDVRFFCSANLAGQVGFGAHAITQLAG
jgi:hypothetical protein